MSKRRRQRKARKKVKDKPNLLERLSGHPIYLVLALLFGIVIGTVSFLADYEPAQQQLKDWGLIEAHDFPKAADDEILIAIAAFDRADDVPESRAHREIAREIEEARDRLGLEKVRVEVGERVFASTDVGSAVSWGQLHNAAIVIWGEETSVRIKVSFWQRAGIIAGTQLVTIDEVDKSLMSSRANPAQYTYFITQELPKTLTFFSMYTIAQVYLLELDYANAIRAMEEAKLSLPPDKPVEGLEGFLLTLAQVYLLDEYDTKKTGVLGLTGGRILHVWWVPSMLPGETTYSFQVSGGSIKPDSYRNVIENLSIAAELMDNESYIYELRGAVHFNQGHLRDSLHDYQLALEMRRESPTEEASQQTKLLEMDIADLEQQLIESQ